MCYQNSELESIQRQINALHSNLKFTYELESEIGQIPFLDMLLTHEGNSVTSQWFIKPSNSGLILNFYSFAPGRYKRSVVRSMVYRIFNSCSNWSLFHKSAEKGKRILENNQYPVWFYEKVFHETLEKLIRNEKPKEKMVLDEQVTCKRLFYIQYRGFETIKFIKSLEKVEAPIRPIIVMTKLKSVLPSLKAPMELSIASNVVYKLTCCGCRSTYVGFTTRHLITRKKEHMGKRGIFGKHFKDCQQNIHKKIEMEILKRSHRGMIHLSIMEALCIREHKPDLNKKDEYIHRPLRIRI